MALFMAAAPAVAPSAARAEGMPAPTALSGKCRPFQFWGRHRSQLQLCALGTSTAVVHATVASDAMHLAFILPLTSLGRWLQRQSFGIATNSNLVTLSIRNLPSLQAPRSGRCRTCCRRRRAAARWAHPPRTLMSRGVWRTQRRRRRRAPPPAPTAPPRWTWLPACPSPPHPACPRRGGTVLLLLCHLSFVKVGVLFWQLRSASAEHCSALFVT